MNTPLRIGMLGAARIGNLGLIRPASELADVEVTAIAARDLSRAEKYARKHAIPKAHQGYQALLDDPDIDAVYIPLPNGLHCEWTVKALRAGKHVLCEKPCANNAREAQLMADTAREQQRVFMEAFHYRHHPMAQKICEAIPKIGAIHHIDVSMCIPLPLPGDIRYNYALGGGASMDVGAYTASILRMLARASGDSALLELPKVTQCTPLLTRDKNVDRALWAELAWANGTTARIENSLWSHKLFKISARVQGEKGSVYAFNPVAPQFFNRLTVSRDGVTTREKVPGRASYTCQLEAFAERIKGGLPRQEELDDAVQNMALIESLYRAAGMPLRGS